MTIRVAIERLVLDGLPLASGADAQRVGDAIEAELSRLFADGGLDGHLASGTAIPSLVAPSINLVAGESPAALGQRIARAVYRGVGS
jgi:hypothetical protein